ISGAACVDWPPLFDFLKRHTIPRREAVQQVDFSTASPAVSAGCHWAGIEAQTRQLQLSTIHLSWDAAQRRFSGTTDNVARLALDTAHLAPGPLHAELDGQKIENLAWPKGHRLWLVRHDGQWSSALEPGPAVKGPHRYGTFK